MKKAWWKEAVIYQIYPRSFMDSNGDGIGDIPGIISRLDYLKELGVTVIWLSPIYRSPNDDNGYDISDYYDIMPEFGTMDEFKLLLTEMHRRGIRLLMDLVVNHTSVQHPWFQEARKSRNNPYRDYYIWRDGKNGGLPNNWESIFSGSVWEYDQNTEQYYMHLFARSQPDLNWENPAVRQKIYEIIRFWLDLGIDGFRMDTANMYSKMPGLPDVPGEGLQPASIYYQNGPRIHEFMREMNREAFRHYNVITVGETSNVTPEIALQYVGESRGELNMVFQFEHMGLDFGKDKWDIQKYEPKKLKQVLTKWQNGLAGDGWNSQYLNNHDQPRQVSRFGDDKNYHYESATMLATLLHTLKGTPFIYQGEELGMTNCPFNTVEEFRDVEIFNVLKERASDRKNPPAELMDAICKIGRDNARTPMQWADKENAGFTTGTPWIKVNPNYHAINAQTELENPNSVFRYYQKLIRLRKENPVMVYGSFTDLDPEQKSVYCYRRELEEQILTVVLNLTGEELLYSLPNGVCCKDILLGNYPENILPADGKLLLRPYQALVFICQAVK